MMMMSIVSFNPFLFFSFVSMILNNHSLDVAKFAATTNHEILSCLYMSHDRCVATDAHMLLEVMHPEQNVERPEGIRNSDDTALIPASSALHASKNIPKGENDLPFMQHAFTSFYEPDNEMTIASRNLTDEKTVEFKPVKAEYVKYESVFPKGVPMKRVVLHAQYLKEMADYFSKHAEGARVELQFFEGQSPVVFKAIGKGTGQRMRGLVMPQSIERIDPEDDADIEMTRRMQEELQTVIPGAEVEVTITHGVSPTADGDDALYEDAKQIVLTAGKATASLLQRRLQIGYAQAAKILNEMEENGLISPVVNGKRSINAGNF